MIAKLTILNSMASTDFPTALKQHHLWGLEWVDLRDSVFGKQLGELDRETAERAQALIEEEELAVYCLSTSLLFDNIESGEAPVKARYRDLIGRIISIAPIFRPQFIRLNAGWLPDRDPGANCVEIIERKHPWLIDLYRDGIDRINEAGFFPVIENEATDCFLSSPQEFIDFFSLLDRKGAVGLTWDVQNQWAAGTFPTMEVYRQLRPLMRYYHVKGGRKENGSDRLGWNTALEDADWAVADITRRVVEDEVSPVICLNLPMHGKHLPDYDYDSVTVRDLAFLRANVPGIA